MRQPGSDTLKALIRGAGDLATGVALCLHHAGFRIVMTELPAPTTIRRTVAFAEAVFQGSQTVEGVTAERVTAERAAEVLGRGRIAVVEDPQAEIRAFFGPDVAVDAILKKRNLGTSRDFAPIVIGLGPGFVAGADVDAVIETLRGHDLGRIRFAGSAAPDTGMPGDIDGRTGERILRAPADGVVTLSKRIGDLVRPGDTVMRVGDVPVAAPIGGCLRGLIHEGILAAEGMKIGDVDPRGEGRYCATVSDKARALGGAVLEAVLILGRERGLLQIGRGTPHTHRKPPST
jgi:xanthine dehydrogenase accessory factor